MKESDKTRTYSDNNKTTTYGSLEKRTKETVHNLFPGDEITLNEQKYKIVKVISESTGEAIIYEVENQTRQKVVLKLYYEFHHSEYEPNTEALARIKTIKDEDILNLIDYGTGINKYKGKYCFEILDFAYGFDLLSVESLKEKYRLDFIVKEVIPQIFKGILRLHDHKIYHCDLKPQNVFYLDKEQIEIVIGDYGSAKTFDFDAAKSSRKTTTVKGTDFYLPPEQARGFISEKNDYYSFGMILLHLVYPEKILINENEPKSLSHAKLKQIIERQFEAKPIIDFNSDYKRMNSLIEGLTLVDFNLRWGKEQVQQWIDGNEVEVIYSTSYQKIGDGKRISVKPLKFSDYTIRTAKELRDYISTNSDWYTNLIEDLENRKEFSNWILSQYGGDRSKRSAFNRMVKNYSPDGIDFVADAIIRFFIPEHPLTIGLQPFNFVDTGDVLKPTAQAFSHFIFDLWDISSEKDIKLFIFSYEFALRQTKNKEEAHRVLKILYQKLSINENSENDFEDYRVFAYTKVTKDSLNAFQEFLVELIAVDFEIEVISLDNENNLHYNLIAILPTYLQSTSKDNKLSAKSLDNRVISLRCPDSSKPFDDFIEKTFNSFKEDVSSKDNILKDISPSSYEKIRETIKNTFRNIIRNLENELTSLGENFSEELKTIDGLSLNLNEIANFLQDIKYGKAQQTYEDILNLKSELKKVVETKDLLNQYQKSAKESSHILPLLEEAEKLIKTNNYKNIEKAYLILNQKQSIGKKVVFDRFKEKQETKGGYTNFYGLSVISLDRTIESMALSNSGNYIALACSSPKNIISIFDTKSEKESCTIKTGKNKSLRDISFSNSDKYLAITNDEDITQVFDFHSKELIYSFKNTYQETDYPAFQSVFSPDDKYIMITGVFVSSVYDLESGNYFKTQNVIYPICMHPRDYFYAAAFENKIVLYNLISGEGRYISEEHRNMIRKLHFSPDGSLIANLCDDDKKIRIWDVDTGKLVYALKGKTKEQYEHICFSPDGTMILSTYGSDGIRIWSVESGEPLLTERVLSISKSNPIKGLTFHPDGNSLILVSTGSVIKLYLKTYEEKKVKITIEDYLKDENKNSK